MQVDAQLIRNERLKRAWSQEQLAQVSGLGIRTVQRIETGGNASLETVKSLAAVLELPVEAILVEAPSQSAVIIASRPARFRLFRPWPAFAAGCIVALVTLGSLFNIQGALAERVAMDFDVTLDDEKLSIDPISTADGSAIALEIRESFRIRLLPTITEGGFVLVNIEIYDITGGEPRLIARPALTISDGSPAMIKSGSEQGSILEILLTPTIQ